MRTQRSFQFTAIDRQHERHAREEIGNNARHAAMKLVQKHPEFWRVLSNKGNPVYTIQNVDDVPPPPGRGAMREALERAKQVAQPEEPEEETVADELPAAPPNGYYRPHSLMAQIREVLVPLLPQLPTEFTRKDVENLLCAHGAQHMINRASVNNVLNTWANQKPAPTTVKRVYRPSGELKEGYYTVLESAKNQGRKAAKMAAKAAGTYHEEETPERPAPPIGARPLFTDPAAVPIGARNAAYIQSHPALRNGHSTNGHGPINGHAPTNGHAPPAPSPAAVEPPAAPATTHASAPAAATVAAPAAPAVANLAGAARVAAALTPKAKEDLFTLLGAGVIGSAQDDKSEIEAAMDMVMQGYDRLTKVMQRQAALASMRERVGLLLQEPAAA